MPGVAGNRTSDPLITSPTPNQLSYFVPILYCYFSEWRTEGVEKVSESDDRVNCKAVHMTTYSVIMVPSDEIPVRRHLFNIFMLSIVSDRSSAAYVSYPFDS